MILRNATFGLRQTTSWLYTFFGRISLETFILQFHIWLAMDTRGLLVIVPGSWWINLALTSIFFVYLSHLLARVTGDLSEWLIGSPQELLVKKWALLSVTLVVFNYL